MYILEISLSDAFAYCFQHSGYVWSFVIISLVSLGLGIFLFKRGNKTDDNGLKIVAILVIVLGVGLSLLSRPLSIKWNSTPESVERGNYVG